MPYTNLLKEILHNASDIAMERFLKVTPAFKDNKTYVTEADIAVQEYLKSELERHFPDDGIIAEEEELKKEPKSGNRYWIVDPIDGTASFVAGLPVWGIAVGVVENGEPVAGFFMMPATKDLFYTSPDKPVYRNETPRIMKPHESFHSETLLLSISDFHNLYSLSPDYPGKVRSLGSTVAHVCYTATGSAEASILGNAYIWDIAAGMAMLKKNGGLLRYTDDGEDGEVFNLADMLNGEKATRPLIAGRRETISEFEKVLSFRE